MMTDKPQIIDLPKILDRRGNLSFIEENRHIPFRIRRSYWIYDCRAGEQGRARPPEAAAAGGSFDVTPDDGSGVKRTFTLNRPRQSRRGYSSTGKKSPSEAYSRLAGWSPASGTANIFNII